MKLDFAEISDWMEFENLVVAFFEGAKEDGENNVFIVETKPTGIGSDGGRDIFVTFGLNAAGNPTSCPVLAPYYLKLVWTGANGIVRTVILPY